MRILIVKLSSLGDIIHTLPVLGAIKDAYPNAQIDWVTEEVGQELLQDHPMINRLIVYRRNRWPRLLKGGNLAQFIKEFLFFKKMLFQQEYDLVIDFQGLLKSGFITWIAKAREKIGFQNGKEGSSLFLDKRYKADYDEHAVVRYLKLLSFAGIPVDFEHITFPIAPRPNNLSFATPYIVINPMARWPSKMWPRNKWLKLANVLTNMDYTLVFTGTQKDWAWINDICKHFPRAINLAGKTKLRELIPIYQKAFLTISVDTGTMHLAAAVGSPVIALFGPTAPWRTGPFGPNHTVIYKGLPCQPCFKRQCPERRCLNEIKIAEIIEAVKKYRK